LNWLNEVDPRMYVENEKLKILENMLKRLVGERILNKIIITSSGLFQKLIKTSSSIDTG
jgi:hypothetical protein